MRTEALGSSMGVALNWRSADPGRDSGIGDGGDHELAAGRPHPHIAARLDSELLHLLGTQAEAARASRGAPGIGGLDEGPQVVQARRTTRRQAYLSTGDGALAVQPAASSASAGGRAPLPAAPAGWRRHRRRRSEAPARASPASSAGSPASSSSTGTASTPPDIAAPVGWRPRSSTEAIPGSRSDPASAAAPWASPAPPERDDEAVGCRRRRRAATVQPACAGATRSTSAQIPSKELETELRRQ